MKRKTEMHITVLLDMIVLTTIIIVTSASASLDLDNSSPVYPCGAYHKGITSILRTTMNIARLP